jgi:hypothetical protein
VEEDDGVACSKEIFGGGRSSGPCVFMSSDMRRGRDQADRQRSCLESEPYGLVSLSIAHELGDGTCSPRAVRWSLRSKKSSGLNQK